MTEEPTDRKVIDSDEYVRKKGKGCTEQPVKEGGPGKSLLITGVSKEQPAKAGGGAGGGVMTIAFSRVEGKSMEEEPLEGIGRPWDSD